MIMSWKVTLAIFIVYSIISHYCAFKLSLGLATYGCGCAS